MTRREAINEYDKGFLPFERMKQIVKSPNGLPVYHHETDIPEAIRRGLNHAGVFFLVEPVGV